MAEKSQNLRSQLLSIVDEIKKSTTSAAAKAAFGSIKILSVKEITVEETGMRALIIKIPVRHYVSYLQPMHARCVGELEKRTRGHVCFVAKRDVFDKNERRPGLRIRPYSRTLTRVHDAMLQDIIGAVSIAGRRVVHSPDGTLTHKVFLHPRARSVENIDEKLHTFAAVYRSLTSKNTVIEFADYAL